VVARPWGRPNGDPNKDQDGPPGKNGGPAAIVWPKDYPAVLRDRDLGKRFDLIYKGPIPKVEGPWDPARDPSPPGPLKGEPDFVFQPLWSSRLAGSGTFFLDRHALFLASDADLQGHEYTALALDDDLRRHWFDFEITIQPRFGNVLAGIFFGWHEKDKDRVGAYFIQLNERKEAGPIAGEVLVAHVTLPKSAPGKPASDSALEEAFAGDAVKARIPLEAAPKGYHLSVHVLRGPRDMREKVTITVNHTETVDLMPLEETRGALGIWARRGQTCYRGASVTALGP
jgi:hypothetical protein